MTSRSPERRTRPEAPRSFDAPDEPNSPGHTDARRHEYLEALGQQINALPPLRSRILPASRLLPEKLHVVNTEVPDMIEDIGCEPVEGGQFWFTWSWGNTLGPAGDPAAVAASIFRVLTPQAWA